MGRCLGCLGGLGFTGAFDGLRGGGRRRRFGDTRARGFDGRSVGRVAVDVVGLTCSAGKIDGFKHASFNVAVEIRCHAKATTTCLADKGFYACMNEKVLSEGRRSIE